MIAEIICLDSYGYSVGRYIYLNLDKSNWRDTAKKIYLDKKIEQTYTIVR